ncbi:hypothetical protein [Candidatus Endomicrobiellum agilis]|uniref:hypothetical protein n=1 Tax=Candidatus Endomicrobiellum agilis TaxID=3238957 RepID=UPI003582BADE|nr:hypothetical protein [Endomicrobium sp.]
MKKIICICICICIFLASGCGKLPNHGSPVNTVVEKEGSDGVLTAPLISNTVLKSSKSPALVSELKEPVPALSDNLASSSWLSWHWYFPAINAGNLAANLALNIIAYAVTVAVALALALAVIAGVYYGGYKLLYEFANHEFIPIDKLGTVNFSEEKALSEGYKRCYKIPSINCYFAYDTFNWIDEIPVLNKGVPVGSNYSLLYKPNSSILKSLKTLLRKKFKMPVKRIILIEE